MLTTPAVVEAVARGQEALDLRHGVAVPDKKKEKEKAVNKATLACRWGRSGAHKASLPSDGNPMAITWGST